MTRIKSTISAITLNMKELNSLIKEIVILHYEI